jgi:hypothetical protein
MSDEADVPAAPNYGPYLQAFTTIAQQAAETGKESLDWARDQVANNKGLLDQVNSGLLDLQSTFTQAAKDRLTQAGNLTTEGINNLKAQYAKYTDPAHKAASMGAAGAQAAQATEAARKASMAELESFGVNPGAVRFGGLDAAARLQSAATRVGAENIAGRQDDLMADQTNQQIINQGNAMTGQANQAAGTGAGAGTGAVSGANATTATGGGVLGTGLQWTGQGVNANQAGAGVLNTGFGNQMDRYKAEQSQDSGIGSLLGLGASMLGSGGAFGSGGALAGSLAFLEEGGAVDDIDGMGGGAVPVEMSPSGGAATDDIEAVAPGGPARLNGGEFVLPKDVVSWMGEQQLQKLIEKARQQKMGAGAKPEKKPAVGPSPAEPAFQPRPQASRGALPV